MPTAPRDIDLQCSFPRADRGAVFARLVEPALLLHQPNGGKNIPAVKGIATKSRLVLAKKLRVWRVAATRKSQQTILLRRQSAEVDRLPAMGKPKPKS